MLAIHLQRDIYEKGFKPNKQTDLPPIIATAIKSEIEKDSAQTKDSRVKASPCLRSSFPWLSSVTRLFASSL